MAEPTIDELKWLMLSDLAIRRRRQTHALVQLKECAHIAALQTIDVRLHLLENTAEPVSVPGLLWDAALAASLGFAGGLVVKGLTSVFNDVLRSRLAFVMFPKSDLGHWAKDQLNRDYERRVGVYKKMLDELYKERFPPADRVVMKGAIRPVLKNAEIEFDMFKRGFLDEPNIRLLYHEMTFAAVDPIIAKAADLVTVQALIAKLSAPGSPELNQQDLPTAAVLRNALSFFNRQIETQDLVIDELEIAVTSGTLTDTELKQFSALIYAQSQAKPESVILNQDLWIRFFELCIWVALYPDIGKQKHRIDNVPPRLLNYLIKRIYANEGQDKDLRRPMTILESAMAKVGPQRSVIKSIFGKDPLASDGLPQGVKEQAITDLAERWRSCGTGMEAAMRRLYPGAFA